MIKRPRSAYELSQSQVTTPACVVALFWRLLAEHRRGFDAVLDLGAGDCRFAKNGQFKEYVGVEIDKNRVARAEPPPNGSIDHDCVFRHVRGDYDACIGNPPYARHHDIEQPWKNKTINKLERQLNIRLNKQCNLFVYFFCLALLKASKDGLVGLVIPYEWVSRPSAESLRAHIRTQRWNVSVYRFQMPIFEDVLTTASITIVDKAQRDSRWQYFDVNSELEVLKRHGITDSAKGPIIYQKRGRTWGLRGLSPGSQKLFTLTEGERIRYGLGKRDVRACVTTLRRVPRDLKSLTRVSFQKYFVDAGQRCWLIRSYENERSKSLDAYLNSIPSADHDNYTCNHQSPWFKFLPHPVPQLVFSSGFVEFGPKILVNTVGAVAIGSVWGIHSRSKIPLRRLRNYLLRIKFEGRVVPHAKTLKKVEVGQLNAVLTEFERRKMKHGRNHPR